MAVLVARTAALGSQVRQHGIGQQGALLRRIRRGGAWLHHPGDGDRRVLAATRCGKSRSIGPSRRRRGAAPARSPRTARAGLAPFLVVGTAGTVDTGAIDDLDALAELCRQEKIWFHVDGAYGALGDVAPELAPLVTGIERADSIAFDFHKWGAGALRRRLPAGARRRPASRDFRVAGRLSAPRGEGIAAGSPWPSEYGPDLSRGFRALKTWFTLKTYGTERLGAVIARTCALARYLERRVAGGAAAGIAGAGGAQHRLLPLSRDGCRCASMREIVADLHESGIAAPSTTMHRRPACDPRRLRQSPHRRLRYRCVDRGGAGIRRAARGFGRRRARCRAVAAAGDVADRARA